MFYLKPIYDRYTKENCSNFSPSFLVICVYVFVSITHDLFSSQYYLIYKLLAVNRIVSGTVTEFEEKLRGLAVSTMTRENLSPHLRETMRVL